MLKLVGTLALTACILFASVASAQVVACYKRCEFLATTEGFTTQTRWGINKGCYTFDVTQAKILYYPDVANNQGLKKTGNVIKLITHRNCTLQCVPPSLNWPQATNFGTPISQEDYPELECITY